MRFGLPVFNIGYFRVLVQILQGICQKCSALLIDDSERTYMENKQKQKQYWTNNRLNKNIKEVIDIARKNYNKKCFKCGFIN